jgi:ATP-dependent Clp protease protease subunit
LSDAVRLTAARARGSGAATRRRVTMMPIGVPRVPYRTPSENSWQWVDIWNCLYRERIIFVSSAINEELGNQLIGTMLFLDSVNVKDVNLYINSLGGDIVPTLALHDTMKHMRSDVGTVAFGGAQAMAGFLLAVGKKGKRCCLPNTHIMLHQPSGTARGQASDINNEARELMRLRAYLCKTLGAATGHSAEQTFKDISRDKYFTPDQAVEYGIIDRVLYPRRTKVPL